MGSEPGFRLGSEPGFRLGSEPGFRFFLVSGSDPDFDPDFAHYP
jgi:hypothetical protein